MAATTVRVCDMQIIRRLNGGRFNDCYWVRFKHGPVLGHETAVVKRGYNMSDRDLELLRRANHKNIITYLGYISNPWMNLCIMEVGKFTLRQYMEDYDLSPELEKKLIWEVCQAVEYLHDGMPDGKGNALEPVVHRHITATKCILFEEKDSFTLKLSDFNYFGKKMKSIWDLALPITVYYPACFAPEVQTDFISSTASDIYALATLFF